MNARVRFPWEMNPWLVGRAEHYYPWPEFAPEVDEYVHVLTRQIPAPEEPDQVAETRPAELRLADDGEWRNNDAHRTYWEGGGREVFAWMAHGEARRQYYRERFGGSYREIIQQRAAAQRREAGA
jgi:hypothetical protein